MRPEPITAEIEPVPSARAREREPYLSIVVTTRNDNHGGDLLFRTQAFVNALFAQCDRFELPAELIVVEWNPPRDRPRLAEAIDWPPESPNLSVRIIEVGEEVHRRHQYSDRLPLFQMIAKNVGIRRARGEFVLATNIDIIFSDELMQFLSARRLRRGRFYRVDRYDVDGVSDVDAPIKEQLRACESSLIRICGRYGTRDLRTGDFFRVWLKYARLPWWLALTAQALDSTWARLGARRGPGELGAGLATSATALVRQFARLAFRLGRSAVCTPYSVTRGLTRDLTPHNLRRAGHTLMRPRLWPRAARYVLRVVGGRLRARLRLLANAVVLPYRLLRFRLRARLRALSEAITWARALPALHTNGCGDFTLMAREHWSVLRGYPELHLFSMFIDSLLVYAAYWQGYREVFLPHRIYHLEHADGFRPDPKGYAQMNERLQKIGGVPQIDDRWFRAYAIQMYRSGGPIEFNEDGWGFRGEEFTEWVLSTAKGIAPAEIQAVGS